MTFEDLDRALAQARLFGEEVVAIQLRRKDSQELADSASVMAGDTPLSDGVLKEYRGVPVEIVDELSESVRVRTA